MADLRSESASLMYGDAGSCLRLTRASYRIGIEAMTSSAKNKRKKYPQDDPEQSKRFIEAARKAGADESKEGAARAFRKVAKAKSTGK
jgi:hypothetical protein